MNESATTTVLPLPARARDYVKSGHVTWALQNRGLAAALVMARAIAANERVQVATWAEESAGWGDSEADYNSAADAAETAREIARDAQRVASIHFN